MTKKPKIGLALCSGGWRGMAHLGVLKALEEENIKIDVICGSSSGAWIGGMYAYFDNFSDTMQIFSDLKYQTYLKVILDPSGKQGIVRGRNFEKLLAGIFGDTRIEDIKVKFCTTATDIIKGETVYIEEGKIKEAVRASSNVPGLFQPFEHKGKKLVDGAISMVVPVEKVKKMGSDITIAVNYYEDIFPLERQLKIFSILRMTSFSYLKHLARYNCKEADLEVNPKVNKNDFSLITGFFKEKDQAIEAGYQAMKEKIPELKKLIKIKTDQL